MPRICTTVDGDLDRRLSAEARRRRITRARLLREAAIYFLGAGEASADLAAMRTLVADQAVRLERLEHQLQRPPSEADLQPGDGLPLREP